MARLVRAAILVLAAAGLFRAAPLLAAETGGYTRWFNLDSTLADRWDVIESRSDFNFLVLRQRGEEGSVKRILSLQSRASSAYDVALSEAIRVLAQKQIPIEVLVVKYDDDSARAKAALAQAEQENFDLIFAMGSEATAWLWANYRGGRLPVVSICAKDPVVLGQVKAYDVTTETNFAFTSLNLPVDVQMLYALEVIPDLRNLAVIVDRNNRSAVETQATPISAAAHARGIRVLNLAVQTKLPTGTASPQNVADQLDSLVAKAVETMRLNDVNLEHSMFLITGSTSVFEQMETINDHSSRVPVISMVPETVQAGNGSAVLSIGVSFRSNGHLAAVYAANILGGRQYVGSLKVGVVTPPDIAINFRRAREIGLKIPFSFFESANVIYDNDERKVRSNELVQKW
jgi:putative ABC transport system substrate-binding protein